MWVISHHTYFIFVYRLIKLSRSDPMSTVGLLKPFRTNATAVSQLNLLEMDCFAVGMHSMNSPTEVQLWVWRATMQLSWWVWRPTMQLSWWVWRATMQLSWWDFFSSGYTQSQLCRWTSLSSGLVRDVLLHYHH